MRQEVVVVRVRRAVEVVRQWIDWWRGRGDTDRWTGYGTERVEEW